VARKYPYDTSADALLKPAKNAVFFEAWDADVDTRNHDLLCAEMSRLAYANPNVVADSLGHIGFSVDGFLGESTEGAPTKGFVASHALHGLTVLAFRGTESGKFEDLISDLNTVQTGFPAGGRIHTGFFQAYRSLHEKIGALLQTRQASLLITGHSLGAALATVAAVHHSPTMLITFGSPRVGDARCAAHLRSLADRSAIHRFVNCCDVVGRVPPERFDAAHFSTLFDELVQFDLLKPVARLAASSLGRAFERLDPPIAFAHVAPPRYVCRDGTVIDAPMAAEQAEDQRAARAAYPHSTTLQFAQLSTLFKGLRGLASGQDTLRAVVHRLFELVRGDPVPLRDLADHAPINYLSGITGRSAGPK
jgi:hypothetical protein